MRRIISFRWVCLQSKVSDHVLYERQPGAVYEGGIVEYGFYIIKYTEKQELANPFRLPLQFMWNKWGHDRLVKLSSEDFEPYVKYTYNWAFNTWEKSVWQEFTLNGKKVGAPVFIVNTTQSPNYPGEVNEREFRSIWNQAWFSSLRSASGLFRYARRTADRTLLEKANLTKELALSFPMKDGFFYGLIGTDMCEVEMDGKNAIVPRAGTIIFGVIQSESVYVGCQTITFPHFGYELDCTADASLV